MVKVAFGLKYYDFPPLWLAFNFLEAKAGWEAQPIGA